MLYLVLSLSKTTDSWRLGDCQLCTWPGPNLAINYGQPRPTRHNKQGCGWMRMDLESGAFERQLHIIHNIMIYIYTLCNSVVARVTSSLSKLLTIVDNLYGRFLVVLLCGSDVLKPKKTCHLDKSPVACGYVKDFHI